MAGGERQAPAGGGRGGREVKWTKKDIATLSAGAPMYDVAPASGVIYTVGEAFLER